MALLPIEIDAENTERSRPESTPLPVGVYHGMVVKTTLKDTKGNGSMVEVEFAITQPAQYSSRKFWDRFNIINENAKAQSIGREALADLAKACGFKSLSDDELLLGKEVKLEIGISPAKPYVDKNGVQQEGKAQNKCNKYWALGAGTGAVGAPAASAPTVAQAPKSAVSKWSSAAPAQAAPAVAPDTSARPWARNTVAKQ